MYKLLLVTDQEGVKKAFGGIKDLNRLMFEPLIIQPDGDLGLLHLQKNGADAVGFALKGAQQAKFQAALDEHFPHTPIFDSKKKGEALRTELAWLRDYLDQLHGDFSDDDSNLAMDVARLQDELVQRLLEGRVHSEEELKSRMRQCRFPLGEDNPCLLFEFALPDGHHYLESRWHHGFDRLGQSLRANFFSRIPAPLYATASLIDPSHLRVLACAESPVSEKELDKLSSMVQKQVLDTASQVKIYIDLELVCTKFMVLRGLGELIEHKE